MSARPAIQILPHSLAMLAAHRRTEKARLYDDVLRLFRRDHPNATAQEFKAWRAQTMKEIGL